MSKKEYQQLIKDNAEISRMLYEKAQWLEDKANELVMLEETLAHWELKLKKKEVAYIRKKRQLVVYEANLKIRSAQNAAKTKQKDTKK